ncbi:MAG: hypothetical protein U0234_05230 [Sandaracinus sp.]
MRASRFGRVALVPAQLGLAAALAGCATYDAARPVAATALSCPESQLDPVVAHSYNLAAGDHVFGGCGRTVVVRCVTTSTATMCRPVPE